MRTRARILRRGQRADIEMLPVYDQPGYVGFCTEQAPTSIIYYHLGDLEYAIDEARRGEPRTTKPEGTP